MDINFAGTNEKFLQLHVLEFLVEDQVGAQLGDVELEILLGEDCWLALVIDYRHQLGIDLALFAQQQGHQDKEGIHDDAKGFVVMQVLYISLYHPLEG